MISPLITRKGATLRFTKVILPGLLASIAVISLAARSNGDEVVIIDPAADASVYTCEGCGVSSNSYLVVTDYIRGVVKFPTSQIAGTVREAILNVNPFGVPVLDRTIDIYAYESENTNIQRSDGFAGEYIGTLQFPQFQTAGEDYGVDVTSFVASVDAPYVGFNLHSDVGGGGLFSSLEVNHGHPAQLRVTTVPEPSTICYAIMFAIGCAYSAFHNRRSTAAVRAIDRR